MAEPRIDVVGIGNAIVDVLAQATDQFIQDNKLPKGAMTLIDTEQAEALYARMGPGVEVSGGSAANTIAGLASLGASCGFIGKVRDDQLGQVFAHDIKSLGIEYPTKPATAGETTARCLILVTPDAQRTMQTYLGASGQLGPDDIDPDFISAARLTYLEGYLWDPPHAKEAFIKAAMAAHSAKREVALSLSDAFCVDRHRDSFLDLVNNHVDVLFANEDEIKSLYQVDSFDAAMQKVRGHCKVAALTRSAKGSVVISADEIHILDPEPVAKVVDTTGAGDAYAAGFLAGYCQGRDLASCGRMGGIAAAEVISHFGARAETNLTDLVKQRLG